MSSFARFIRFKKATVYLLDAESPMVFNESGRLVEKQESNFVELEFDTREIKLFNKTMVEQIDISPAEHSAK